MEEKNWGAISPSVFSVSYISLLRGDSVSLSVIITLAHRHYCINDLYTNSLKFSTYYAATAIFWSLEMGSHESDPFSKVHSRAL